MIKSPVLYVCIVLVSICSLVFLSKRHSGVHSSRAVRTGCGARFCLLQLPHGKGSHPLFAELVVVIIQQRIQIGDILAAKLGFDAETLRALNPRLIYVNIHAFGDRGPLAEKPGYDPLMQAFAGLMSVTRFAYRWCTPVSTS